MIQDNVNTKGSSSGYATSANNGVAISGALAQTQVNLAATTITATQAAADVNVIKAQIESGEFVGNLLGDVIGTTSSTVVSRVGNYTRNQINSALADVIAATPNNTPNTIVKRDGAGNISAQNGNFVNLNVSGNISITDLSTALNMNNAAINNVGNLTVNGDVTLGNHPNDTISFVGGASTVLNMENQDIKNVGNLTVNGDVTLGNHHNDAISFFGVKPVSQQSLTVDTLTELITALRAYGLIKQN